MNNESAVGLISPRFLYANLTELDNSGVQVVEYVYDAWGNHTVSGSNIELGNKNPFRYRSYFYDTETGLYFLKTRYYDPTIGRFLNRDSVAYADPETLNGLNLYAYCLNNPVNYCDPSGHFILSICILVGLVAGAVIGGTVSGINAYQSGARGWDVFGAVVTGAVIGGALGAAAGFIGGGALEFLIIPGAGLIGSGLMGGALLVGGSVVSGGALVVAGAGAVAAGITIAGAGIIGAIYLFSKHNPGMSTKPPVSWTTFDEGLSVYKNFGGDSNKATEYLLNQFRGKGNWHKGAGTEFNAIKKWFDRIIRLLV